jgi:tetratricopeptide (TPR) repeat protein
MELALRHFLAGHVLRKGMLRFETLMNPWVKEQVKSYYGRTLRIDLGEEDERVAESARAVKACEDEKARLAAERENICALIRTCSNKDEKQALKRKHEEVGKKLKDLNGTPALHELVPRWIKEVRGFFHMSAEYVHAADLWDVLTITTVMQSLMSEVFAQHLSRPHAKEFLHRILRVMRLRNNRAHPNDDDGTPVVPTESEVIEALRQMDAVMQSCKVGDVSWLMNYAHLLVQHASNMKHDSETCNGPLLTADEGNAQVLYMALMSWQRHVEVSMDLVTIVDLGVTKATGKAGLKYVGHTVAFGHTLDPEWHAVITRLKPHFRIVATARHWYFHHKDDCDFARTFTAMELTAKLILEHAKIDGAAPWRPPTLFDFAIPTTLRLQTPSTRMSVPIAQVYNVVGRKSTVDQVTAALTPGARVLIHGLPGVGKDTVMAEVERSAKVRSLGGLQEWLCASSDMVLRRQLIELFATHRTPVVAGLKNDANGALAAIKRWLATNDDWVLFVEDASISSTTLWKVLPDAGIGGRALITSQAPLGSKHSMFREDSVFRLGPISTDESIELIRGMKVFAKKAPAPPKGESEEGLLLRCKRAGAAKCYENVPLVATLNADQRKQRRRIIETGLFEHVELARSELRSFLEDEVGNLPLSVALCGHMLRRVECVADLIARFKCMADMAEMDRDWRDDRDKHYYGLYLSVKMNLAHLQSAPEADREAALTLLAMMSLLDREKTPVSLLSGHDAVGCVDLEMRCYSATCRAGRRNQQCFSLSCTQRRHLSTVLVDGKALEDARRLCVEQGLVYEAEDAGIVCVMHQLVQRCLRCELVAKSGTGSAVVTLVRNVLLSRFDYDELTSPFSWPELRRVTPCIQAWCDNVLGKGDAPPTVALTRDDNILLTSWVGMLLEVEDDASQAQLVTTKLLEHAHAERLPCHPDLIVAMSNQAVVHFKLGLHDYALTELSKIIPFLQNAGSHDPENYPFTTVHNLASIYSALGMHIDACVLRKKSFELRSAALKKQLTRPTFFFSEMAVELLGFAETHGYLEMHEDAHEKVEAALLMLHKVDALNHTLFASAIHMLAQTFSALGWHRDALTLNQGALQYREQYLPPTHSDIVVSMSSVAMAFWDLGQHETALAKTKEALWRAENVLPPHRKCIAMVRKNLQRIISSVELEDQLDSKKKTLAELRQPPSKPAAIARSATDLASAYSALGQHDDALKLQKEAVSKWRVVLRQDHPTIAQALKFLAETHQKLGRRRTALHHMTCAIGVMGNVPPGCMRMVEFKNVLANMTQGLPVGDQPNPDDTCLCESGLTFEKCCQIYVAAASVQ